MLSFFTIQLGVKQLDVLPVSFDPVDVWRLVELFLVWKTDIQKERQKAREAS